MTPFNTLRPCWLGLILLSVLSTSPTALAQTDTSNAVTGGEFFVEPATLMAFGFEWHINGDDNRNANVAVQYRETGSKTWHQALPLLRLQGEYTRQYEAVDYTAPNMFSGSIFDLQANTAYEVQLTLSDPDGVSGTAVQTLALHTRAEPQPAADGHIYHVYPTDYKGEMQQPGFKGLLGAYYTSSESGDWSNATPARVQPGDILLVHAGTYTDPADHYSHEMYNEGSCCYTTWDGTYYLTQSGTMERPIVIKSAGDGEVIFDGHGNEVLFDVMGASYQYFEGLTFRNTRHAILAGRKKIAGSEGLTVKHSRFVDVGIGIHSDWSGSRSFYIADNVFIGRHNPDVLTSWLPEVWRGVKQPFAGLPNYEQLSAMRSYYAIKVYGSGHVIAYNEVRNFHDGIDHATYGNPDNWPNTPRDRLPVAIDIYNNDISTMHDNCIETDGAAYNIRVLRNRCFNSATGALSAQPLLGGPVYFVRNVVYQAVGGILKIQANPSGVLHYNNTYIGELYQLTPASNMHYRNNLVLGTGRRPALMEMNSYTNYSSSDYNGFMPNPNEPVSFIWHTPEFSTRSEYSDKRIVRSYQTLKQYSAASSQDRHSILIDYNIFQRAAMPALDQATHVYQPADVDLRLKPKSVAVDAGLVLPGITDNFSGKAPDLGAYEYGAELPHYGPRRP